MTTDASRRLNCPCQQGSLSIHKHMCCLSTAKCRFFSREYFKSELFECQIGSVWLHFNYSSHWILLVGDGRCATSVGKGRYVCKTTAYKTLLCLSALPQEWEWRSAMSLSASSSGVFLLGLSQSYLLKRMLLLVGGNCGKWELDLGSVAPQHLQPLSPGQAGGKLRQVWPIMV